MEELSGHLLRKRMLKELNQEQKAAVEHFGSPLLLLAGAGSDKTKVLTHKIGYLIREKGFKPNRILAICGS
jgi:DNA helicase-2/ATP-dependent DNA helicase PcrA